MIIIAECILFCLILYEYKRYHMTTTPIVIIAGMYFIFIPLINTVGVSLGFYKLNDVTILCFVLFILEMFMIGTLVNNVNGSKYSNAIRIDVFEDKLLSDESTVTKIYLASLVCYVINLLQVIRIYGIENTKSKAFGMFAHLGFFSRCLMPVMAFYFIKTKKTKYLIYIIVHLIALIIFKGKYHLYIPVVGCVIMILFLKRDIKMSTIFKVVVAGLAVAMGLFSLVYTTIPLFLEGILNGHTFIKGMKFSIQHFFQYLFDPFIASNEFFANPSYRGFEDGLLVLINPFHRLFEAFFGNGNYHSPVINMWPMVNNLGAKGNVGGIFSESVVLVGYLPTVLYLIPVSILLWGFFNKTLCTGKYLLTTIYLMSIFALCFFCNYFTLYPNFECLIYCILIDLLIFDKRILIGGKAFTLDVKFKR